MIRPRYNVVPKNWITAHHTLFVMLVLLMIQMLFLLIIGGFDADDENYFELKLLMLMMKVNLMLTMKMLVNQNFWCWWWRWFWCWWWKCLWIKTCDADDEGVVESQRESILLLSAAISRQNPAAKSPVAEFTTHLQNFHKLTFPHITSWIIWTQQNRTRPGCLIFESFSEEWEKSKKNVFRTTCGT